MVKSVLGVNHQGLTDWAIQRATAILMAIYIVGLIVYLLLHPDLSYQTWRHLFSYTGIKIATVIFLISWLYHAWIGIWIVLTEYVKSFVLRAFFEFLVLLMLAASLIWGVIILWSVS